MVITQTPLRLSFAGGGSDLADYYLHGAGRVISTAIDKYIFVIIKERFDDKIVLNYSRNETVDEVNEIKHELIRAAMEMTGLGTGVEISTLADIPSEGSGLGSSSSLVVGLLNAMYQYLGRQVSPERLAREACEIEIERCGKPIGKQDQYIAAFGGLRRFTFNPDQTVTEAEVDLPAQALRLFGSHLMLFYTNRTRKSAEILTEQKSQTGSKREVLDAMMPLVDKIEQAFTVMDFEQVGRLLHAGWELKKKMAAKISDDGIDDMYGRAIKAGAVGGKIAGAGGGGFLLLYVPPSNQDSVRNALSELFELPFMPERDGSKVIFNIKRYPFK
ncbi:MAG: GHMP kinase [Calditrichaeota bacterium]|nr:GHMP kinase [Calditrichota bacterium]MCB9368633.1 GHMP kinase [Calditrichota bacterium]